MMMYTFVEWAMRKFNGQRFGICGKTVDSTIKNIIYPFQSLTIYKRYNPNWRRSDKTLELTYCGHTNTFEIFGGKDEASAALIQGRTLAGVFLDEVVLMPRSFVEQALTRCSVEGSRLWFSCNPGNPSHWFYEEWILGAEKHRAKYIHFAMQDNPSLSDEIIKRYERDFSGVFYQRYVLGEWVAAEGLVYPMFDEDKHVTDETPWLDDNGNVKRGAEFYISCDYGITNPFSAHLWAIYQNKAYCFREYYFASKEKKQQRTDEEHYKAVERLARDYPIEDIIIDPSATSFKETVRRHGRFNVINANNDVLNGISTVSTLLNAELIQFAPECKNLIDEFAMYSWDADSPEDEVIKENDHAMDDMRYFCYTVLRREFDDLNWEGKPENE